MNRKTGLYHKIDNHRARVTFATALAWSLDSRIRGNDVRVVKLEVLKAEVLKAESGTGKVSGNFGYRAAVQWFTR